MTTRSSWTLTASLAATLALAAPASAAEVTPPSTAAGAFTTAAIDPGCKTYNRIAFQADEVLGTRYRVRHAGQANCDLPMRIRCAADLYRGELLISSIGARSRNRCEMGSDFWKTPYSAGTGFREKYRYRFTLLRERHTWAGTTDFCPRRTDQRKTLICFGSHRTDAPDPDVDRHG